MIVGGDVFALSSIFQGRRTANINPLHTISLLATISRVARHNAMVSPIRAFRRPRGGAAAANISAMLSARGLHQSPERKTHKDKYYHGGLTVVLPPGSVVPWKISAVIPGDDCSARLHVREAPVRPRVAEDTRTTRFKPPSTKSSKQKIFTIRGRIVQWYR